MTPRSSHVHRPTPRAGPATPAYLLDGEGKVRFVLLPAEQYRRVRPLLEPERASIEDTYPLQEQVAHAAGWDDPRMDAYDEYDAHRRR